MTWLPREMRLEMLIGHLADQLPKVSELKIVLRSNASAATRNDLANIHDVLGSLWSRIGAIREEAAAIRAAYDAEVKGLDKRNGS
jgi:hypothetical protein